MKDATLTFMGQMWVVYCILEFSNRKHTCLPGISSNIYPTTYFTDLLPFSSKMSSSSATLIENTITRSPPRIPSSASHSAVLSIKLNEISPPLRGHGVLGLLGWVHSLSSQNHFSMLRFYRKS
jgi:hypothetical protein